MAGADGSRGWRPVGTRAILSVLLACWAFFIVYGTMLPFDFRADVPAAMEKLRGLDGFFGRPISWTDVVSNVLLFVPWGLLLSLWLSGRGAGLARTLLLATTSGLAFSASVECAQLFLPSRTTSPIDLATNAAGAALGALAGWPLLRRLWPVWRPALGRLLGTRPLVACALVCGAALVLSGLAPFDVSLDVGDLRASIKRARPIPFGPPLRGPTPPVEPWSWALEGMTWTLVGGLVALAVAESLRRNPGRTIAAVAVLCGGLAVLIEVVQVILPSRTVDATTVVFAVAGSTAGASVVALFPRRDPRGWIRPAIALWAVTLMLAAWTPPHLKPPDWESLGWSRLVPFWAYYRHLDLPALFDLMNQVLGFIPLGALLAARGAKGSVGRAFFVGLGIGLLLEVGQLALADRTAEITDALSSAAGAALGAVLWGWGASLHAQSRGHRRYRIS